MTVIIRSTEKQGGRCLVRHILTMMLSGNVILIKIRKSLCNDGCLWGHNTKIIKGGKIYSTQQDRKCDYKSGVGSDIDISRHRFIQLDKWSKRFTFAQIKQLLFK